MATSPITSQIGNIQSGVKLQDKLVDLVTEGWEEPVLYRGRVCGTIRLHSDRLLHLFLQVARPEEWGRRPNRRLSGVEASPVYGVPDSA